MYTKNLMSGEFYENHINILDRVDQVDQNESYSYFYFAIRLTISYHRQMIVFLSV